MLCDGGEKMKKMAVLGMGVLLFFLLVGCNPKEKPKELFELSFDNMMNSKGYNLNNKGTIDFDSKKMTGIEGSELKMFHDITSVSFDVKGSLDNNQKSEWNIQVKIPYKQDDVEIHMGLQSNEKEKQILVDNDAVMSTIHSLWKFAKYYNVAEKTLGMNQEEQKEIEDVFAFLDKQLKDSYTSVQNVEKYGIAMPKENMQTYMKQAKEFFSLFPEEAFQYEKEKQGQYGHIVVKADNNTMSDAMIAYNKKQSKESLKLDEELFAKAFSIKKMEFHILVNEEKQIHSIQTDFSLETREGNTSHMSLPLSASITTTFSHINNPTFNIPKKEKRIVTFEQVEKILTGKMADIEKQNGAKQPVK